MTLGGVRILCSQEKIGVRNILILKLVPSSCPILIDRWVVFHFLGLVMRGLFCWHVRYLIFRSSPSDRGCRLVYWCN